MAPHAYRFKFTQGFVLTDSTYFSSLLGFFSFMQVTLNLTKVLALNCVFASPLLLLLFLHGTGSSTTERTISLLFLFLLPPTPT